MSLPQVSVDIFKGFPDEESIVNYTLNQAYQDNVTVFASELVPARGLLAPHTSLALLPARLALFAISPLVASPFTVHLPLVLPSLASLCPCPTFPSFLSYTARPHFSRPHPIFSIATPSFKPCPLSNAPVSTPRCHLPDPEGWLPPTPRALQDPPELQLH